MTLDLKKRDETRHSSLEEIKHNNLMSKKHKKVCGTLNYFELLITFVPAISGYVSISTFMSSISIVNSEVGLNICAITAIIKKCK